MVGPWWFLLLASGTATGPGLPRPGAPAARRGPAAVPGGSPDMPRHLILSSPGRPARGYDVDVPLMQPGVHGRVIHAL
jgi:hypothetical protein